MHLAVMLSTAFPVLWFGTRSTPLVVAWLATGVSVLPLVAAIPLWIGPNRRVAKACVCSSVITLPLAIPISLLTLYSIGMASVGGMRY